MVSVVLEKSGTVQVYLQLRNQRKNVMAIRDTEVLTPAECCSALTANALKSLIDFSWLQFRPKFPDSAGLFLLW